MNPINLAAELRQNPYPGRGIVIGRSADRTNAVIVYFIMGRSVNSRNRVFVPVPEDSGIRTEICDPSKLENPSLILYHPVRFVAETGDTIVTNGDQTDTIRDGILSGLAFAQSLSVRSFEPDPPNYTPRISGILHPDGSFALSILKSAEGDPSSCCRYFFDYDAPRAGEGRFLHTYQGAEDTPLLSFAGEPKLAALCAPDASSLAEELWESLNFDNKVSLFVRYIDLETGKTQDCIRNKYCKTEGSQ